MDGKWGGGGAFALSVARITSLATRPNGPLASSAHHDPSRPPPPLTLQTTGTLSHLNPDAALSDDDGAGGGGAGAGGGGLTESGRPRRRAVR
ncbi:hypothetical protein JCM10450v2_003446 [Rhodotorula kratochvilovae]